MKKIIYYKEPATQWSMGCLLGNGFMGETIYGGIQKETIVLSEATFISGREDQEVYHEDAATYFARMKQEAINHNHKEVKELTKKFMGKRENFGTNLPVGQLELMFHSIQNSKNYRRELDLNQGICKIQYDEATSTTIRESFSSYVDRLFCYSIQCNEAEGMSFSLYFQGKAHTTEVIVRDSRLCFKSKAQEELHSDGVSGSNLLGVVSVDVKDGELIYHKDYIEVKNSHSAVIYLAMETDYDLHKNNIPLDFGKLYELTDYRYENYETLKKRHREDFECFMKRQEIDLVNDEKTSLMHQLGRYIIFSSSREKSILPAHLQGVWNDNVACNIGWSCDMHLDINTQMNYWISESGNLAESHGPLFRWMEEKVIPNGRRTAKECYGKDGWVAELVSNGWGYTAPYWNESLSPCPTSGIWMASDYMEHYRFTRDLDFLEQHAYPVLHEAVLFFIEYIFEDEEGYYVSGPAISPENGFVVKDEKFYASIGCTNEILMIRELFQDYIEISQLLGFDHETIEFVKKAVPKLLPYRIHKDGTIKEWNHEYPSHDLQHRHTSHLLGLFPYHQISPETTPELCAAARKTIEAKLAPYENWEDTGWARNLIILYYARLRDKEMGYFNLKELQRNLTNEGLLVMHPSTRGAYSFADVYEIDGNTGFSMAVIEMLVQCFDSNIELFPALPQEWKEGRAVGLVLRGGVTIDLTWNMESSILVTLYSDVDQKVQINWNQKGYCEYLELKAKTRHELRIQCNI